MSEEFKKIGPGAVSSENGFTVRMKDARGGIIYRDATGEVVVDSERSVDGSMVLLDLAKTLKEAVSNLSGPT
jgi:hypothetical protein